MRIISVAPPWSGYSSTVSGTNWNLESVGFCGGRKAGEPRETPFGARMRTNNKHDPIMMPVNTKQYELFQV